LKSYKEITERVRSGYFHKPSSRRFNPVELASVEKQQALSPEGIQMEKPKGTEIQKSYTFARFQMEFNSTEASASGSKMEVGHTEASPSVSRMAEKQETLKRKSRKLLRSLLWLLLLILLCLRGG
jgi:hypothetical protein